MRRKELTLRIQYFGRKKDDDRRFGYVFFTEKEDRLFNLLWRMLPPGWGEQMYINVAWCGNERFTCFEVADRNEFREFAAEYKEAKAEALQYLKDNPEGIRFVWG